jgi:hypothetical protein
MQLIVIGESIKNLDKITGVIKMTATALFKGE